MSKTIHKMLAEALRAAKSVSNNEIVRSSDLERQHRERLVNAGWLHEVIQGWYILSKPEGEGSSTLFYGNFWSFVKVYLAERFSKTGYCLSPEATVDYLTGETIIPKQLMVFTKKPSNTTVELPQGQSLFLYHDKQFPETLLEKDGLNLMQLPKAIYRLSSNYYASKPLNAELALKSVPVSEISAAILENPSVTACQRIIGAYYAIEHKKTAEGLIANLAAAGIKIKPENPFKRPPCLGPSKITYPFVGRLTAMWNDYREQIIETFSLPKFSDSNQIKIIEKIYQQDAYHSLSIEGYHVTEELIAKIGSGEWDPNLDDRDKQQRDAMAAKGYLHAFRAVLNSLTSIESLSKNPGEVFNSDLQIWYRELFSPSVKAGILKASNLSGYRSSPVFIDGANHVPPSKENVIPAMDTLFELLTEESNPVVRAILGHFIFVFIHPYPDGNGRIGRFLMNLMFASGGFNWTVIRVESQSEYMKALDAASSKGDISQFTRFVESEMIHWRDYIESKLTPKLE